MITLPSNLSDLTPDEQKLWIEMGRKVEGLAGPRYTIGEAIKGCLSHAKLGDPDTPVIVDVPQGTD